MWNTALIFSDKNHGLQKKLFIEKKLLFYCDVHYAKIVELHTVHSVTFKLIR